MRVTPRPTGTRKPAPAAYANAWCGSILVIWPCQSRCAPVEDTAAAYGRSPFGWPDSARTEYLITVTPFTDRGALDLASTDRDLALSVAASLAVVFPTFATFDFTAFPKVTTLTFVLVGFAGALLRVVNAEVAGDPPDPHAIV